MPTSLDSIFFHWTLSSLVQSHRSGVRCQLPLSVVPRQLPVSSFLQPTLFRVPLLLPDTARFQAQKPFVWFRAKTDKGIVCLAGHLYSVTILSGVSFSIAFIVISWRDKQFHIFFLFHKGWRGLPDFLLIYSIPFLITPRGSHKYRNGDSFQMQHFFFYF